MTKFLAIGAAAVLCCQASAFAPGISSPVAKSLVASDTSRVAPALKSPGAGAAAFGLVASPLPSTGNAAASSSRTVLFMGWGPDPEWSTATVAGNEAACPSGSCVTVTVTVSPDLIDEFAVPGQYVQLRQSGLGDSDDNKPLFLAIASPPAASSTTDEADAAAGPSSGTEIEFLIKKTDNNGWITSATPGTSVEISQVMGGGFPMEENFEGFKFDFPTQNVLLFATGSGIAPIRSVIESGLLGTGPDSSAGRTARLYYGASTPDDMPYAERFAQWESSGVEVVPVISRPEEVDGGWSGRAGYIQNALEEDGVPIPRNTGAVLCGVKGMCESVKDIMTQAGTFEGRVLTNF
mmetsp:Transcript_22938/g.47707  ORF Transcript_22938/g.47707 Transcript_22938/m.47707 type:complete len:350 (+) Transcript_22938:169-1218(+)